MNLRRIRTWLSVALALLFGSQFAVADGKLYAEKVPTTIPYQRALILHDAGVETLVLQSQYQIPGTAGARALGWVVPVPAPPEVGSLDAQHAERIFNDLDYRSMPETVAIGLIVLLLLIGLSMTTVLLGFGWAFMTRDPLRKRRCVRVGRWAGVVFLLSLLLGPFFIRMRKGAGVEILSAHRTGIYDIQVVRSPTAAALTDWLNEHAFRFGKEDEQAFQAYLDRGWCFVVARIDPAVNPRQVDATTHGLLAPLILRFPSPNPVYPVALTATGGHPTEILIYLVSSTPMTTASPLARKFSGELTPGNLRYGGPLYELGYADPPGFFDDVQLDLRYLAKFKATLTPAEMARDLEFRPAPDAAPFRERRYRW
jgi:hypothetical protein